MAAKPLAVRMSSRFSGIFPMPNIVKHSPRFSSVLILLVVSVWGLTLPDSFAGVLFSSEFDTAAERWAAISATGTGASVTTAWVVDAGTSDPSGGNEFVGISSSALVVRAVPSGNPPDWNAVVASGPLQIGNTEQDLRKLTLSFDLKPSSVKPVRVEIRSLGSSNEVLGSRSWEVIPQVANGFFRYSLDLSDSVLSGTFSPTNGRVEVAISFGSGMGWNKQGEQTLAIDNISYTSPTFYVSPTLGSDSLPNGLGLSEARPFRSLGFTRQQLAAGDVVCLMNGDYTGAYVALELISEKGTPAKWIVLRSSPGHTPKIKSTGWHGFQITAPSCYVEIRDLTFEGNVPDIGSSEWADMLEAATTDGRILSGGQRNRSFNTNAITINGRLNDQAKGAHHVRIMRNRISRYPGAGVGVLNADYVTIENNIIRDTNWLSSFGGSGISLLHSWNFDQLGNHKSFIVGNECSNNRCYVPWNNNGSIRFSDGNGIIIDTNSRGQYSKASLDGYSGRTLMANNLVYGSGGAGIAITSSWKIDIINNTVYHNVQTEGLKRDLAAIPPRYDWGDLQISAVNDGNPATAADNNLFSRDVRVRNNIFWGDEDRSRVVVQGSVARGTTDVSYNSNIFYGDLGTASIPSSLGDGTYTNNLKTNPLLKNPQLDSAIADFTPQPTSPAIDFATTWPEAPGLDFVRNRRPSGVASDVGAYEVSLAGPGLSALQVWRELYFSASVVADSGQERTVWGDAADPDGDGLGNLLEFAIDTDPLVFSPGPSISGKADGKLKLTFARLNPAPVRYMVSASENLVTWSPIATLEPDTVSWNTVGSATASGTNGRLGVGGAVLTRIITISDGVSFSETPRRFLRLGVEKVARE